MPEVEITEIKRCAIYTRTSVRKHLPHEVTSLLSQREISSSYINSQKYRGWVELPDHYDDDGHSGSGLDRPGLVNLMKDIEAGKVDGVIVYKIDRLTRSLADFVRLIEIFDQQSVSLTSISQAFDTSDSMGRMILNILLTFSQFERELTSERIRDNIRIRKQHGLTHGGVPPFGYIGTRKGLQIVEQEAEIVRFVFDQFLKTRRYARAMHAVRDAGFRSTVKHTKNGKRRGGKPITAGMVYSIIHNPIYVGEIRGKGRNYEGVHEPIISRKTWNAAQALSEERKVPSPNSKRTNNFLAGLLWDDMGRHMLLEISRHQGRAYRAYASSNAAWSQREFRRAYRCQADNLDKVVMASVADFLCDRRKLRNAVKSLGLFGKELDRLCAQGKSAADRLKSEPVERREKLFAALICRIEVGEEKLSIYFRSIELRRFLLWKSGSVFRGRPADWPCSDARYELEVVVRAVSAERWPSLHIKPRSESCAAQHNEELVQLIKQSRKALRLVEENREWSIEDFTKKLHCRKIRFARLIRLNYLAPDIVTAILDGTQPATLTCHEMLQSNIPTDWAIQRRLFGFPAPRREIHERKLLEKGMWPTANG